MTIKNKFEIGQFVFVKHDKNQEERMIVGIIILPNHNLKYILNYGESSEEFFEIEISVEKDIVKATTN